MKAGKRKKRILRRTWRLFSRAPSRAAENKQKSKRTTISRLIFRNHDGRADFYHGNQFFRVPVGQAEAAVGSGLADVFRMRCAMDAIAGFVEPNPDRANRVVWARRNKSFGGHGPGFSVLSEQGGIKRIVRMLHEGC